VSQPRLDVILLGDKAYSDHLKAIMARIEAQKEIIDKIKQRIKSAEGRYDERANAELERAQGDLNAAENVGATIDNFYKDVKKNWATAPSRVVGHVAFSPPFRLGAGTTEEEYTQDSAIIKVDKKKIDRAEFKGNLLDLENKIPFEKFNKMMNPNPQNTFRFKCPKDRLLQLRGTIPDEEMSHPRMLDQNGDPCIMVIKNGSATGVTIGRANGIKSCKRTAQPFETKTDDYII